MKAPIQTLELFPLLDRKLIDLLRSLAPGDWNRPTRARLWTVKDIVAHLLDGNFRTINVVGENYIGDPPGKIDSYSDLVGYLNRLNSDWVKAMRRMSPATLVSLLEITGPKYYECLSKLDPFAPAVFAVDWAGESESQNWFHIAREYTEKWHHQQQIREAVGKPGIMGREFYYPMITTFMRALPHTYRSVTAPVGFVVRVTVAGDAGGRWTIVRSTDRWNFCEGKETPNAEAIFDPETAWQLFTKGISKEEAASKTQFSGDKILAEQVMSMVSVMA